MPTNISWKLSVDIPSGPSVALSSAVPVDAYDRIAVTVPASGTETPVDIQPGASGRVKFLMIRSDNYGDDLTYKVSVTGNPERKLNDVLLLVGAGGLELLEDPLDKLLFKNSLAVPANIEIIVGRQAI